MPDPRYKPDAAVIVLQGRGHCETPATALVAASLLTALGIMLLLRNHGGDAMLLATASGDFVARGALHAGGGAVANPVRNCLVTGFLTAVGRYPSADLLCGAHDFAQVLFTTSMSGTLELRVLT